MYVLSKGQAFAKFRRWASASVPGRSSRWVAATLSRGCRATRVPAWSWGKRPASRCAVDLRWSSRDGGSRTRCADARAGCCSPTSRCNRDRPVRRDELAEALWSGKGAPPAYESLLAPPLSRLRKALGPGVLEGRSELRADPARRTPGSTGRPRRELRPARPPRARRRRPPGRVGGGRARRSRSPTAGCCPASRRRGSTRAAASWPTCASRRSRRSPPPARGSAAPPGREAEQAARAAVQAQPFRESARAVLMEVLRARGNVNEALRVYEDVRVLLREELGSSPGARAGRPARAAAARRPAPAAPPAAAPAPRPRRRRRRSSSASARSRCSTRCSPRRAWGRGARC